MKKLLSITFLLSLLFFISCETGGNFSDSDYSYLGESRPNGNGNTQPGSGLITAGEWNDLANWGFLTNLLNDSTFAGMPNYWGFYTNHRIAVVVKNGDSPVIDAKVELLRNGSVIWTAKTDNNGSAELWVSLFQKEESVDFNNLTLQINGVAQNQKILAYSQGVNYVNYSALNTTKRVEIAFIVDATGSMSDELEFLKADLQDVIDSVKDDDSNLEIYTSAVFYRDEGDEYLTRKSDFTNELSSTVSFIGSQRASGGGDFPEAVHTALNVGINELQWANQAKTRIAFLLLDAPPHYTPSIVESVQNRVKDAAEKGIKIIPITASGIDKDTEFLMRFMAISTNGTYVFITNDSGIGGEHLAASVGEYQVEYLKSLMIRLIKKYSK